MLPFDSFEYIRKHTHITKYQSMISIRFFAFNLLLVTGIFAHVNPQNAIRTYIIEKDFFNPIKAGEFTVSDTTGKEIQYRVESKFSLMQSVEVIAYPSKKVIAKLDKKFSLLFYKAAISILDPQSNQWIEGTIEEKFLSPLTIDWNGQRVKMEFTFKTWSNEFIDENNGAVLAKFNRRLSSLIWTDKYELNVFSDKLPDAAYILGIVAMNHKQTQNAKSSSRNG